MCAAIEYKGEKPGLDWWGINYYARGVVGPLMTPVSCPGELMTDMKYALYPASLYENIVRGSALKVPMYISEIGAADRSEDDHIRIAHIESFTRQVRAPPAAAVASLPRRVRFCASASAATEGVWLRTSAWPAAVVTACGASRRAVVRC